MNKFCQVCNNNFTKKINESKKAWSERKFCSRKCINTGRPAWNKGTPMSEEVKKRVEHTFFKKGNIPSPKAIEALRARKGPLNNMWKGGITPLNHKIRWSSEMIKWRKDVFARDNYTCQTCQRKRQPGDRVILNADHIKPFASFPELRFDINNGRTLCEECHKQTATWGVNQKYQLNGSTS